ncbi:reverse transcriptase domain-containing protein [uncultured Chryseobacterium sp.]|uniref:reverse transcriptase domain-containing protein n=1 Tax=uncultured Chryseobacterium sp. TaxID=259322 RepID=UPI0025F6F3C2|nr:reverse transcriptase domain-containing protein [uncultured Chryseobacterium sp.]
MIRITKEELYFTYRKVKRELFINKDTVYFDRIIRFENNLEENINILFSLLIDESSSVESLDVGEQFFTLKKIKLKNNDYRIDCNFFDLKIDTLSKEIDYPELYKPEINEIKFRSFGDLSLEFQIIAGLWINKVGYEFEKEMTKFSYGNRLKDISTDENYKENHTYYKPYFKEYKNWQENLIDHITECNCSNEILVINTDFENFFPDINLEKLRTLINSKYESSTWLTNLLFSLIEKFNKKYNCKGLPLNLICSSSLANIYLLSFDDFILNHINPLYYGRYVDDLLLAIDANDEFARNLLKNRSDIIKSFCKSFGKELSDYNLSFNKSKSKFILLNKGDKNKFSQLKDHINKTSSEWRLIPSTEKYSDSSLNLNELFADDYNTSHLTSLKETYSISTRRNYFIKEILNFERTYFILDQNVWRKRLIIFFIILEDVIFDLENFALFQKHIPRLVGLLVQTKDNDLIIKFVNKISAVLDYIDSEIDEESVEYFKSFRHHLKIKSLEFINYFTPVPNNLNLDLLRDFIGFSELKNKEYFNSDLHFEPLFNSFYKYNEYQSYLSNKEVNFLEESLLLSDEEKVFIKRNLNSNSCAKKILEDDCGCLNNYCVEIYETFGFYFFTRRITLLELTIAFKNKIIDDKDQTLFYKLSRKFYSKVNTNLIATNIMKGINRNFNVKEIKIINPDNKPKGNVVICNTHFLTKDDSFLHTLQQLPEPDAGRTDRIINLVNEVLRCGEKIDYLVFHELAIPRNLYLRVAQNLSFANINLVAGLEYCIDNTTSKVDNQLLYVLKVNDEYSESIALYQSKILPAIHEEREIREREGYSLAPCFKDKLIINHNEFFFSGMICNDLINIDNRSFLRGSIDFLFVVAWNTDTGMYEHLIKTTSFDNHTYVLLCNNKKYGDSQIFIPYSKDYMRYLQRINGGKRDNFMVSEIDILELRKFQINKISPSTPFKPVPTGFEISENRKKSLIKLLKK